MNNLTTLQCYEFHFSDVHAAMNHIGSLVEVVSRRSHLKQIKNLQTVTTSNHIAESHAFYDAKFDHVTSRDTMLFMEL